MTDEKSGEGVDRNLLLIVMIGATVVAMGYAIFSRDEKAATLNTARNDAIAEQTAAVLEAVKVLERIQLDQQMHNARQVRQWQDSGSVHPGDYIIRDDAGTALGSAPPKTFSETEDDTP